MKEQLKALFSALPHRHKIAVSVTAAVCTLVLFFPSEPVVASRHTEVSQLETGVRYQVDLPEFSTAQVVTFDNEPQWVDHTVRSGDTLARIFKRAGLTPRDTHEVSRAGDLAKMLVSLRPGEQISIKLNDEGLFSGLKYQYSTTETLYIHAEYPEPGVVKSRNIKSHVDQKDVDIRLSFAQGEISSSFWNAGVEAGLTDNQIMELAGIFGWDIDFASEIRSGDTFNIVFEEKYIAGEFIGYGDIIAAEFVNQNEEFNAIKFTDGNYYTADGRSMRKSFLRAPIHFTRVSSNFNPVRFHPVLKRIKPHRGVDYVAPVGTPVMSAGDGKVVKAGYDKYNGHHVFVQHGEKYTTKYLHFKSRAVKVGQTVKQGQVIGYLGSSGMVTGAHLHYEFLVDGVHRNPRTVELPKADPIETSQRAEFEQIAATRMAQLSNNKRIMLAMN